MFYFYWYLFWCSPPVFEHRFSRDFIRVVFICLLTEVVYTCWRWWNGERDVAGSESAKRLGRFFPGRGPLYTREESSRTGGKEVKKVPEISILDQDAEERRDCVRRKPGCCVRFPGGRGVREKYWEVKNGKPAKTWYDHRNGGKKGSGAAESNDVKNEVYFKTTLDDWFWRRRGGGGESRDFKGRDHVGGGLRSPRDSGHRPRDTKNDRTFLSQRRRALKKRPIKTPWDEILFLSCLIRNKRAIGERIHARKPSPIFCFFGRRKFWRDGFRRKSAFGFMNPSSKKCVRAEKKKPSRAEFSMWATGGRPVPVF